MTSRRVPLLLLYVVFVAVLPGSLLAGPLSAPQAAGRAAGQTPAGPAAPAVVTLISDDFESGTSAWDLDSHWSVVTEGSNHVLQGSGHAWASARGGENWTDYTITARVKLLSDGVQLMFRMSNTHGRYILGINGGGLYLRRESPWEKFSANLASSSTGFAYGQWYSLRIKLDQRQINVNVNSETTPRLSYTDNTNQVLWQGTTGLEVVPGGSAAAVFDDIVVVGLPAVQQQWVKTGGPIGGLGYDVRYGLPLTSVMYVTDNYSGVNKSSDGGQTWSASNRGITGRFGSSGDAIPVFALTIDPNNPDIVWAGLKDVKGVYKSTNAGQSWTDVTPAISEAQFVFRGFTIMPGNSNEVFAQGELPTGQGSTFDLTRGRVYYTADGGQTWTKIWEDENLARYVIVRPDNHDIIYISTGIFDREADNSYCYGDPPATPGGVGVVQGVRSGATWTWTKQNAANGLTDLYIGSLVMHPTNPNILLAGAGNNACSEYWVSGQGHTTGGVFRTTNGGQLWVKTLSDDNITSVEFAPSNPEIAYAGSQNRFYASQDGGQTWTTVAGQTYPWGPPGVQAGFPIDILVDPNNPLVVYANNYGGGNIKSTDGGVTWSLASTGYTGALMLGVAVDPSYAGTVYSTARSGAFRSFDAGTTWQGLSTLPAHLPTAYGIAVNPDHPQVLLVGDELLGRLYRSTNGGQSWTQVYQLPGIVPGQDDKAHGMKVIAFAPSNSNVVYAGSCRGSVALQAGNMASLGVYRSVDGGVTWGAANDTNSATQCINDLAVDPGNPDTAYAASAAAGLLKTVNGGATWSPLPGLSNDVRAVAVDPTQSNVVYVGTQAGGIYRSTSSGASWSPLVAGMEPNDPIWSIVFDPANPSVVWAGSFRTGVYRWDSSENLWIHVNAGLRTRAVVRLAISSDGSVLYAATSGEGVFRLGAVPAWKVFMPLILR